MKKLRRIYDKTSVILQFILSLLLAVIVYKMAYKYEEFGQIYAAYLIVAIILTIFIILNLAYCIKKNKDKLEKIFVYVVIPVGMLYMVLMIPCQAPDEEGHIFKSYDVSLGHLITDPENNGDIYVPEQMLEMYKENINTYSKVHNFISREADYTKTVDVQTAAKANSPIGYWGTALAYWIGRMLNLNLLLASYFAKLINFILFIIAGYYIIKIMPFGKLLTFAYLLLPMILHQATSITADAITNIAVLLFIAYNLKLLKQDRTINRKQRVLYYLLVILMSLGKMAYFPLVSIGYILIANKKVNKKDKTKLLLISTILAVVLGIGYYMWSLNYTDSRAYYEEAGVNSSEQIHSILTKPTGYIKVLHNTFKRNAGYYLVTCIGRDLGRLVINVPEITIYLFMLLLFATPFLEKHDITLNRIQKIWFILIFLGISFVILTSLFVGWTPVGLSWIAGVQGRYFIPILILLLLAMCTKHKYIEFKNVNVFYGITLVILNLSAISAIIQYF